MASRSPSLAQPALGAALLHLRHRARLPIQEAAAKAGVAKGLLWRIEQGSDTQISTLNKIVRIYGKKLTLSHA